MRRKLRLRTAWKLGALLGAGALVLAACGSSTPSSSKPPSTSKPVHGGTLSWAEAPAATPDWIFPFTGLDYFSTTNLNAFQYLIFRPLYWFGAPGTTAPTIDYSLSFANAPVWSNGNKTVTITLKGWKFYDGQKVDAQSVVFWMNMMKAEASNWAGTAPGPDQFPQNIVSYSAPDGATGDKVVFNLNKTYSTEWYLYNELSQITQMPEAWDVTSLTAAPGSGGCGKVSGGNMTGAATKSACVKVWTFDTDDNGLAKTPHMAADLATYATNPLWKAGTDGPWLLHSFDAKSSASTFVPNPHYSGPQKPYLAEFKEVPYTSDTAEYAALASGSGPQVGYLPSQDTPPKPKGLSASQAGPNDSALSSSYNLVEYEIWQINYFPENFDSTLGADHHAGSVFKQLYFRQVLQYLVDQTGMITTYFKGYGVPTYGPAPVYPSNTFAHGAELSSGGPYPFSQSKAINLLKSHGWKVVPNGTSTCEKPGTASDECGAGIPKGTPLSFSEVYASGVTALTDVVDFEVSEWAKAGIQVKTKATPFDDVLKDAVPCVPKVTSACETWDMANWGGGWLFAPDYLPTGEEIFASGAGSNSGNYNDAENNRLIKETNSNSSLSVFYQWENYLAKELPVIWQPIETNEAEISKDVGGKITPFNALDQLTPEYWYLKKS